MRSFRSLRGMVLALAGVGMVGAATVLADYTVCETSTNGNCTVETCRHYSRVRYIMIGDDIIAVYSGYLGTTTVTTCG